jgi:hypothetical protein
MNKNKGDKMIDLSELDSLKDVDRPELKGYFVRIFDKEGCTVASEDFEVNEKDKLFEFLEKYKHRTYAKIEPQYYIGNYPIHIGNYVRIELENTANEDEVVSAIASEVTTLSEYADVINENIWGIYNNEADGSDSFYDMKEKYQGEYYLDEDKLKGMKLVLTDCLPKIKKSVERLEKLIEEGEVK